MYSAPITAPSTAPGYVPWYISPEDCMGDTLPLINNNTNYLYYSLQLSANSIFANITNGTAVGSSLQLPDNSVVCNPTGAAGLTALSIPDNSIFCNPTGTTGLTALTITDNQVLCNPGGAVGLSGLTIGTNQVLGNVGSGLAAINFSDVGIPTGAIMPFYLSSAPSGWRVCDGTTISNSGATAALYAAIGNTLPDLRGMFIRGAGTNGTYKTATGVYYAGGAVGAEQNDMFQGHHHLAGSQGTTTLIASRTIQGAPDYGPQDVGSPSTDGTNGTPRTGSETRPANISFLYCIKL